MNILAINPFKFSNYVQNNKAQSNLTIAKPLLNDTVSFKAAAQSKFLKSRSGGVGVSRNVAKEIAQEAAEIQTEIERFFGGMFDGYVVSDTKPKNLIAYIIGRSKKAGSIEEKSKVIGENTKAGVFRNMTDLNALKTVMYKGDRRSTHKILDVLLNWIKRGLLILEEVEVKRPAAAKNLKGSSAAKWDYAAPEKLAKFVSEAEDASGKKVNFPKPDLTPANYTAIHYLFRLPGQKRVFEGQLMGPNVALFKDLDDILYKILNNKNVDKKFKPLVNMLNPLIMTQEDKTLFKYIKIREKIEKLKFSEEEYNTLLSDLLMNKPLTTEESSPEYAKKIAALSRAKDFKEEDLHILSDNVHLEADYQDKEFVKKFKDKVDKHEKFKAYRAQAFLFQREKNTSFMDEKAERFLPLTEDLPMEYDLNELYKIYLKCLKKN